MRQFPYSSGSTIAMTLSCVELKHSDRGKSREKWRATGMREGVREGGERRGANISRGGGRKYAGFEPRRDATLILSAG